MNNTMNRTYNKMNRRIHLKSDLVAFIPSPPGTCYLLAPQRNPTLNPAYEGRFLARSVVRMNVGG